VLKVRRKKQIPRCARDDNLWKVSLIYSPTLTLTTGRLQPRRENGLRQAYTSPNYFVPEEVPAEKLLSFKLVKSKKSPDLISAGIMGLWGTLF
jgi:hypothetical protein